MVSGIWRAAFNKSPTCWQTPTQVTMTSCPSRALQKHGSEVRKERRAVEAPCNPDDDADVPRELTADEQEAVSLVSPNGQ